MGTLKEINQIVERRNLLTSISTNRNWKDNIRSTIQRHCSMTKSFNGSKDIFYSVYGLGEGVWGLRSYINLENEINSYERRKIDEVMTNNLIDKTEKEIIISARIGQGKFRKDLLNQYRKCIITGIENPNLLIASHIKPWRSSDNKERLSIENGLILSALYDKLFDLGYISFDKNTKLLISRHLSKNDMHIINFDTNKIYIPNCNLEMKTNLEYHNNMIFKD